MCLVGCNSAAKLCAKDAAHKLLKVGLIALSNYSHKHRPVVSFLVHWDDMVPGLALIC